MGTKGELLETLSQLCGCSYLSDLRSGRYNEALGRAVSSLQASDYAVTQWNEAIRYVLQSEARYSDSEQARACLLDGLSK